MANDCTPAAELDTHSDFVYQIAFSPDGKLLAAGSKDKKKFGLWDTRSWNQLLTLDGDVAIPTRIDFSPDGSLLATATIDKTFRVWCAKSGQLRWSIAGQSMHVAFSPNGKTVAFTRAKLVRLADASNGNLLFESSGHTSKVEWVAFSADGSRLASSAGQQVRLWDAGTGRAVALLQDKNKSIYCLASARQSNLLVTVGKDSIARLWDASTATLRRMLAGHGDTIWSADFSPVSNLIATASWDESVRLWSTDTGDEVARFVSGPKGSAEVLFSSDGSLLASNTGHPDYSVKVWSVRSRGLVASLRIGADPSRLAFSPDGRWLAVASHDGKTRIWDIQAAPFIFRAE
jgi:WD40 repeat protein